jgi:hypothetical protein
MSIPLSDRRADPRHSEPVPAKHAARPPSHGKDRHWHRGNGNSHKQGRRHQPVESAAASAGGIEAVAFLQRNAPPRRDRPQRTQRWTGQSKGS